MKFNNILVVLPKNEKQYALARAVRLVKEQKSETKVKITTFMAVYDLSYEMSALLSSEERENMHKGVIEQRQKAIIPFTEKYADPNIDFDSIVVWNSNEAEAIGKEVEQNHYNLVVKYTQEQESLTSLIFAQMDWQYCINAIIMIY